jgi:hypothetical protein
MVNPGTKQPRTPVGICYMRVGDSTIRPLGALLIQHDIIYRVTRHMLFEGAIHEVIEPLGRFTDGRIDWFSVSKE